MNERLWRNGPCSQNYMSARFSFDKGHRFGRHSIYHKDDVHQQKLKISDLDNPELLLKKFRKEIQEASNERFKRRDFSRKRQIQEVQALVKQKQLEDNQVSAQIQELPVLRDWFGNRTSLVSGDSTLTHCFMKSQRSASMMSRNPSIKLGSSAFTNSQRLDLSRPLNFYPAPNTYHIRRLLEDSPRIEMKSSRCSVSKNHSPR